MRKAPQIREYMTPAPLTIGSDCPLADAIEEMKNHDIRHLPVRDKKDLVGILTWKNLNTALMRHDSGSMKVGDVMIPGPFTVKPDTLLSDVAAEMAEEKYGSVIVVDGNDVVGMFTTIDACRALREILDSVVPA